MARSLAVSAAEQRNNFNLLRLACAIAVIVSHSFPLTTGVTESEPLYQHGLTLGGYAVIVFFGISGFLIAGSFERKSDVMRFAVARARRIYPALTVVLLVSTLLLGAAVTDLPLISYYRQFGTFEYLANNFMFDTTIKGLPGVFVDNPHRYTVNGSLWSLPLEVICYCLLYGIGRAGLMTPRRCLIFLLPGLALCSFWRIAGVAGTLPHVMPSFLTGMALYVYRERIPASVPLLIALTAACFATRNLAIHEELVRVTIAYGALCFATGSSAAGRYVAAKGDYSYGLYLYGWPVTQAIVFALPWMTVAGVLTLTLPITAALACASWHLVERPALRARVPGPKAGAVLAV